MTPEVIDDNERRIAEFWRREGRGDRWPTAGIAPRNLSQRRGGRLPHPKAQSSPLAFPSPTRQQYDLATSPLIGRAISKETACTIFKCSYRPLLHSVHPVLLLFLWRSSSEKLAPVSNPLPGPVSNNGKLHAVRLQAANGAGRRVMANRLLFHPSQSLV